MIKKLFPYETFLYNMCCWDYYTQDNGAPCRSDQKKLELREKKTKKRHIFSEYKVLFVTEFNLSFVLIFASMQWQLSCCEPKVTSKTMKNERTEKKSTKKYSSEIEKYGNYRKQSDFKYLYIILHTKIIF